MHTKHYLECFGGALDWVDWCRWDKRCKLAICPIDFNQISHVRRDWCQWTKHQSHQAVQCTPKAVQPVLSVVLHLECTWLIWLKSMGQIAIFVPLTSVMSETHKWLLQLASVEKLWPKGLCASTYLGQWTSKTWATKIASMSVSSCKTLFIIFKNLTKYITILHG